MKYKSIYRKKVSPIIAPAVLQKSIHHGSYDCSTNKNRCPKATGNSQGINVAQAEKKQRRRYCNMVTYYDFLAIEATLKSILALSSGYLSLFILENTVYDLREIPVYRNLPIRQAI